MNCNDYQYRERLPVCSDCNRAVPGEYFYLINDEVICPECMEKNYKKEVKDYI